MTNQNTHENPGSAGVPARTPLITNTNDDAPKAPSTPRGWHNRGYLPHCDLAQSCQFITYRLDDALPPEVARRLTSELETSPADPAYRLRIENYLDAGHGECILRHQPIATIVRDSWQHFDGVRYDLQAWVIMPNHVHVLITTRQTSLSDIVQGWKSYTARKINISLGRNGKIWQADYWDRYIRDDNHYAAAIEYIRNNPTKAGLASTPEDWPWTDVSAASPGSAGVPAREK